jgi:uncharacterized cupin superfamily protein
LSKSIVIATADTTSVKPTSVTPSWILTGKPENRAKRLAESRDRNSYTMAWDCTAGRFNWHYNLDETVVVLSGEAFISSDGLEETRIGPGDVVYFPAGCSATWRVTDYIRKVAFLRQPIPPPLGFGVRAWNALLRILGLRPEGGL